jgi:hypothetical protein
MRTIATGLGVALAALLALPAAADGGRGHGWKHRGHHHGHHHGYYGHRQHRHGGGVYFSFRPAPRYIYPEERQVVVIERPVVVERPIVVQAPPGVALGREIADGSGRYCREYQTSGRIAGRLEQLWGVACLQPDGSWELAG